MFHSFFPKPKLFFSSFVIWALLCVVFWFTIAAQYGQQFSLGGLFGSPFPEQETIAKVEATEAMAKKAAQEQAATEKAKAASNSDSETAPPIKSNGKPALKPTSERIALDAATKSADTFWFYQYTALAYLLFVGFWLFYAPHKWSLWSVAGSALIIFATWFQVQIDVLINAWFRDFYDMLQLALSKPNAITSAQYFGQMGAFLKLAMVSIIVLVLVDFFTSHYVFRWRTAMNNYYMSMWEKVRHIEGASQRIQEDTMRFSGIVESLGVRLISSAMTLIAFLPILWGLSGFVKYLPIVGEIPQALVFVAILWSIFGTTLLALVGIKLPGLQFRNQRVEAAYRKELVFGEDDKSRAQPPTVNELFGSVRKNYFRLYFHYLYFNIVRYSYLQVGVLVSYIALGPTIIAAGITLGVLQQIRQAFGQVENSFQYLVNSWTTIVELLSIHKRLIAFEAAIRDEPLPAIDQEYLKQDAV